MRKEQRPRWAVFMYPVADAKRQKYIVRELEVKGESPYGKITRNGRRVASVETESDAAAIAKVPEVIDVLERIVYDVDVLRLPLPAIDSVIAILAQMKGERLKPSHDGTFKIDADAGHPLRHGHYGEDSFNGGGFWYHSHDSGDSFHEHDDAH